MIEENAFYNCRNLLEIKSLNTTPPTLTSNPFGNIPKTTCILKVPFESITAYKSAIHWRDFLNIVPLTESDQNILYDGNSTPIMRYGGLDDAVSLLDEATSMNALVFSSEEVSSSAEIPAANIVAKDAAGQYIAKEINLTDAQPFFSPMDVTADAVEYTRTFYASVWQPLYLPFAVKNDADVKAIGRVAYINNVHQYDAVLDNNTQTIVEYLTVPENATLLPNRMYVIKPNNAALGNEVTFTASDNTLKAPVSTSKTCTSMTHSYTFTGIYQPKTDMYSSRAYALTATGFQLATSDEIVLSPFRFFLKTANIDSAYGNAASSAPAHIMIMVDGVIEGEVTGVEGLQASPSDESNECYSITGQKVSPTYKGIVIKNGKKVLIK